MLTLGAMERIEEQAFEKFVENGKMSSVEDDDLVGEIPDWYDADAYHMVRGECTIPGDVIKDWLYDDFRTIVEYYLKSCGYHDISDTINPQEIPSITYYFEYCMDFYQNVEDYFWEHRYPDLRDAYFEKHARKAED